MYTNHPFFVLIPGITQWDVAYVEISPTLLYKVHKCILVALNVEIVGKM